VDELLQRPHRVTTLSVIFLAMGIPMFARGMEIKMLTSADFKNAKKNPSTKPKLIATITKAMGMEMTIAARHENTML
jgi:hypothetical protein